jgi:hypothetical protein
MPRAKPTKRPVEQRPQTGFIERGLKSLDRARESGVYVSSEQVFARLERRLATARRKL